MRKLLMERVSGGGLSAKFSAGPQDQLPYYLMEEMMNTDDHTDTLVSMALSVDEFFEFVLSRMQDELDSGRPRHTLGRALLE